MEENNEIMTQNPVIDTADSANAEVQAATEQAAGVQAATEQAATEQAAGVQAATEQAAGVQAATEQAAGVQAAPEQTAGVQAAAEQAAGVQAAAEQAAGVQAATEQAAGVQAATEQAAGVWAAQNTNTPQYQGNYAGWQNTAPNMYNGYRQEGGTPYGYGNSMYGNYYNPNSPMQNRMPPYMTEPQPQPEKKKHIFRKKHPVLVKVLEAVVFGLVAALAFIGCNYIYGYFFPEDAEKYNVVQIAKESVADGTDEVKTVETIETVITSNSDVSKIVEKVAPAIVQIDCMFNSTSYFGSYQTPGAGSGIVIKKTDKELLIATNNHVVEGAVSIKITFTDGTTASAEIKGTDSVADLAVVSIDITTLDKDFVDSVTVAKLGSSDDVRVGQMAIAIGNAMGYGQSTTVGYISAKDREVTIDGTKMILIQTDAAINPGNSGGALINVSGEVIGINSVKFSSAAVEGMGFAIPISRAQQILDELGNREALAPEEKGYLGVHVQTVTSAIAQAYKWPMGVYVAEVDPGLAAETSGIEIGDIIIRVNAVTVSTTTDLRTAISSYRAGTEVKITVMRLVDNEFVEKEIEVVLGNEPEPEEEPAEETAEEPAEQPEESGEETNPEAPIVSPKDGLPENPETQTEPYTSEEIPDYFDPFKDLEDMFPFYEW